MSADDENAVRVFRQGKCTPVLEEHDAFLSQPLRHLCMRAVIDRPFLGRAVRAHGVQGAQNAAYGGGQLRLRDPARGQLRPQRRVEPDLRVELRARLLIQALGEVGRIVHRAPIRHDPTRYPNRP